MKNWSVYICQINIYLEKKQQQQKDSADPACLLCAHVEESRLQEDPPGTHISHLLHHPAQFRGVDGHHAHLLLRVRGTAVGYCSAGNALHRVRRQMPREVPRPAQRWLPAK